MGGRKRVAQEDINIPEAAHEVDGGYPVHVFYGEANWDLTVHIYGPIISSPRPRVTRFGAFMPADYKKHCAKLGSSMAYARGIYETSYKEWKADSAMWVDLAFWSPKMPGDLDNLIKTVLDAGQLSKGEPPGAELWTNDRQVIRLQADWIDVTDDFDWQTVVRVKQLPGKPKK
jgi:Holliday junction resolvase RusA-like endonuclease